MNIIFYSKNCRDCCNLLTILKNENMIQNFVLFCVDGRLHDVPPNVTMVPTMIVSGINKPLAGKETFEWINKAKFLRQQNTMNMNKQNIMKMNLMRMASKKGPHGFLNDEMNGISDGFAYTKTDMALPHRYVSAAEKNKNAIFTAPESKQKISPAEQQRRIEELQKEREGQDTSNSEVMKKQQINAVIQAEQEKFLEDNPHVKKQMEQQQMQQQKMMQMQQLQNMQQMQKALQMQQMRNRMNNR